MGEKESYPVMAEADRQGCRLENGDVRAPRCHHRLKEHYDRLELSSAYLPEALGGHGYPMTHWTPMFEDFVHNIGFLWLWASPLSIAGSIAMVGTEEQIHGRYLPGLDALLAGRHRRPISEQDMPGAGRGSRRR